MPDYRNPFFGEPWDSPMFDDPDDMPPHADTPVGRLCGFCSLAFEEGDQGIITPAILEGGQPGIVPWHKECMLRQTVGSPFHQLNKCSCHGGENFVPMSPAERRAEALAAWDLWHQIGSVQSDG